MNDDIVTRLRRTAEYKSPITESVVLSFKSPILSEAADEIERLREQVAALNMVNWSYKEMVNEEYEDD